MNNQLSITEKQALLDAWLETCPRECASLVFATAFIEHENGRVSVQGIYSVIQTDSFTALKMIENAVEELNDKKKKILVKTQKLLN